MMDRQLFELLKSVDTPTVCNAIEVAQGKRGFAQFTRGTMLCSAPDGAPMVGYARTARIRGLTPPDQPAEVVKKIRMDYYRYMAEGPRPAVVVIEDTDYPNCVGAFWGEVNTTLHKGLGLSGALTNSVMRDLGDLPDGFPVVAGSIGPSHGFVHVLDFDEPVEIFGLTVQPNDLVPADRHGAVVVPEEVVSGLHSAIERLIATEKLVLEPARTAGFDISDLEAAWSAFEAART